MNGYSAAPQHSEYPEPQSTLAPTQHHDTAGLASLSALAGDHQAVRRQHEHGHVVGYYDLEREERQGRSQQQAKATQQQERSAHNRHHHPYNFSNLGVPYPATNSPPTTVASTPSAVPAYYPSAWTVRESNLASSQEQYGAPGNPASNSPPTTVASTSTSSAAPAYSLPAGTVPEANPVSSQQPQATASPMPPQSPAPPAPPALPGNPGGLAPPPEGIYRTFDELLASVQRYTDQQGYNVVKLRASNYRDGKPTRYDLVCDRGGVRYISTAKKRNPSTRKVDCPWRAKAVCEVNLNHQWRFVIQESRHNHEARVPAAPPGQENTPVAQSLRSMLNKIDRLSHDMMENFNQLKETLSNVEKRLEALERERPAMLNGNGVPQMGAPSMPPANMGGSGLGNGSLANGGMQSLVDSRLSGVESGLSQMGSRGLEGLPMMDDETRRLSMMVNQ